MFSFNNPFGACEKCTGLGTFLRVDPELVIPDKTLSIRQGAIKASGWSFAEGGITQMYMEGLAEAYHFSLDTPVKDLPKEIIDILLYGTRAKKFLVRRRSSSWQGAYQTDFEGICNNLDRRYHETNSDWMREEITSYMNEVPCPECHGDRLKKEYLSVLVGGINISDFCKMSVVQALEFVDKLHLTEKEEMIAHQILKEIKERLGFLRSVGLEYLTLSRSAGTLSGEKVRESGLPRRSAPHW